MGGRPGDGGLWRNANLGGVVSCQDSRLGLIVDTGMEDEQRPQRGPTARGCSRRPQS